jgi:hypothetical protein
LQPSVELRESTLHFIHERLELAKQLARRHCRKEAFCTRGEGSQPLHVCLGLFPDWSVYQCLKDWFGKCVFVQGLFRDGEFDMASLMLYLPPVSEKIVLPILERMLRSRTLKVAKILEIACVLPRDQTFSDSSAQNLLSCAGEFGKLFDRRIDVRCNVQFRPSHYPANGKL